MKREPKVSVIIPIYNAAEFLEECLDSVIAQTLENIEIICVNDGSSDNSLDILQEYKKRDSRIRVLSQSNQGAGVARNNGISVARGEYLSFLDADDFFEKNMLKCAYKVVYRTKADIGVFNADLFNHIKKEYGGCTWAFRKQLFPKDNPFKPLDEKVKDNIFRMFNGWAWDKLFSRKFIGRTGLRFQELRTTNDMYFVFIGLVLARKIVTIDKLLIHQRVGVKSSLSNNRDLYWNCFYIALLAMQSKLKELQLYDYLEKAFVNWALNFSLWQLNTMQGKAFIKTYNLLRDEGFEQLDISRHDRSYFFNPKEYDQFLRIMATPVYRFKSFEGEE